jgi:outer membrane autotransporter protein
MQRLEVRGGALRVNSDYQFASDGTFLTRVNGDGSSGQLIISGTGLLDGALSVSRGRGPYLDGTTYDVVQASNGLEGTFSTVILPKPSFLLRFKEIQHADTVQIEVLTKSFWTVAVNSMQKYIAEYLDRILPTAGGDLANVIGEFQGLPESGYSQAFSSLSPDFYARTADVSRQAGVQYLHTLSSRMDGIRANGMTSGSSLRSDIQPEMAPLLAYSGADASIAQLFDGEHGTEAPQRYGLWIDGFGKWGERDGDSGHYGYNYDVAGGTIGLDFLLNKKVIVGVSGGYSSADIDLDDHAGDGTVRSGFGSIYGSYFTDRYFLETALSYSRLDCESKRGVVVGELEGYARSDHNGDAYSAYLGGGYNIAGDQWLIQPLASLFYTYLDEDGFQETGAGGVSLAVDGRSTESLESEVGLRLARAFTSGTDTFVPELRVAWKYDFGLDDQVITAAFAGSPNTTFSVAGQDIDRNGIVLGAGISFMQKGGFSARLRYEGELREDYRSHGVLGELRYAF